MRDSTLISQHYPHHQGRWFAIASAFSDCIFMLIGPHLFAVSLSLCLKATLRYPVGVTSEIASESNAGVDVLWISGPVFRAASGACLPEARVDTGALAACCSR